jgi:hypothetical protein
MFQPRRTVLDAIEILFRTLDEEKDVRVYMNTTTTPPTDGTYHLVFELTESCTLIKALILALNRCKMKKMQQPEPYNSESVTPSELVYQLFVDCHRYGSLDDEDMHILYDPPSWRQLGECVIRVMDRERPFTPSK